jgi:crotonobetainyl-CoA:carnitine CoA-transferase CaiB-like acyl-CoA transferase
MAALYDRERTGRGQAVETSLLRCGAYAMSSELAIQLYFGKRSATRPRTAVGNPLMNRYCAGDGRWFFLLGIEADRHWPRLLEALDDAELAGDDRFSDVRKRRHNVAELVAILDRLLKARTRDEWARRFDAADVWWAPVLAADEVVADPQAIAAGVFVDVPDQDGSTYRSVATPLGFGAYAVGPSGPVPALGEHTRHVLFDLGYTTDEVAELVETGVIDGKR